MSLDAVGKKGAPEPAPPSLGSWLTSQVELKHADLLLLLLSFGAGAIDTIAITTLSVFAANMTGNVILLALSAGQLRSRYPDLIHPVPCVTSLLSFCFGTFMAGQIGNRFGQRTRWVLLTMNLVETLCIFVCAILIYSHAVHLETSDSGTYAILVLLSYAMGEQQVWSRSMGVPSITVTVLTNATAFMLADPGLFSIKDVKKNKVRNQRVAFIVCFFVGALVGSVAFRFVNSALTVVITGITKAVGVGYFILARSLPNPPAGTA